MINIKQILLFLTLAVCITACKKKDYEFDSLGQFQKDTAAIKSFLKANNITEGTMDPEYGIYYHIINTGTGNVSYKPATKVTVNYTGRLLNGSVFDSTNGTPGQLVLGNTIAGWYYAIPKVQKGGKMRVIIPSFYGYGNAGNSRIPANSVLDFDVEVVDVIP
jgi:FKBP-type peptidyl-prolyl cis-trans isomerase FkpA